MKKLLITACMALAVSLQANAQSLFKTVMDNAVSKINSAQTPADELDYYRFEESALRYIQLQVQKRGLKVDGYFYDSQAVNMKSFIDDYRYYKAKATQISEAKFLEVSACYRDASIQNPYFKDTDKEKVNSYLNSPKTKVPFSMDTDWEKAYDQASKNIKAIIK